MKDNMRAAKHDKTGKIYFILDEIPDCTNSEKDKPMILYMNLEGQRFVRERSEFWLKFSSIDNSDIHHVDRRADEDIYHLLSKRNG
jgi:hypothetical protein